MIKFDMVKYSRSLPPWIPPGPEPGAHVFMLELTLKFG